MNTARLAPLTPALTHAACICLYGRDDRDACSLLEPNRRRVSREKTLLLHLHLVGVLFFIFYFFFVAEEAAQSAVAAWGLAPQRPTLAHSQRRSAKAPKPL